MSAAYSPSRDLPVTVKKCRCGRKTEALDVPGIPAVCSDCALSSWLSDMHAEMAAAEQHRRERAAAVEAMHTGLRRMLFAGIVKGGSR